MATKAVAANNRIPLFAILFILFIVVFLKEVSF